MSRFDSIAANAARAVARHYGDPIVAYDPPERLAQITHSPLGMLLSVTVYHGDLDYAQTPEQAWRLDVLRSDFATTPQKGDRLTLRVSEDEGDDKAFIVDGLLKGETVTETGDDGTVVMLHVREDLTP